MEGCRLLATLVKYSKDAGEAENGVRGTGELAVYCTVLGVECFCCLFVCFCIEHCNRWRSCVLCL